MGEIGIFDDLGTVRFQRLMPVPAEQVWAYLTETDLLSEWLGGGEIAAEIGGKIELRSGGPVIRGIVLVREDNKHLSYSWNAYMPMSDEPVASEAILSFDLGSTEGGTLLSMSLGPIDLSLRSVTAAGWHGLLDILRAGLAGEEAPDFMETVERVLPAYEM